MTQREFTRRYVARAVDGGMSESIASTLAAWWWDNPAARADCSPEQCADADLMYSDED